ncbi:MAG: NAD-binding protein [Anaerolineales bacterium]|nr:NAD-binding protein [Anaerolineales bacterium]
MDKPTFKERFGYWFDNMMAKGTPAMILLLAVASFALIFIAGLILFLFGIHPAERIELGLGEAIWASLMRTLDPGTMGGDTGPGFRFIMLTVTIGGIFIVSTLIGVLNSGLETQLERLRKGRSRVLENGHTLILGWSPQVFTIIAELMIANENQTNARIVVLADQDKVEMEEKIRERIQLRGTTRVIVRSGDPIDLNDLELGSPHTARSIIVLPPENDDPDSNVIKAILALTNNPNRRKEPYHIVTQIRNRKNMDVVRMIGANDKVFPLLTGDLIARVVAQTARQSGLSMVYTELMNFGGDEIYFKQEPNLSGKTFGEALLAYEDSTVMGLRKVDGTILLNPPMDTRIEPGDHLFALSEDDDTIRLSSAANIPLEEGLIRASGRAHKPDLERTLLIGWNRSAATIIQELDAYVAKGSQVTVFAADHRARDDVKVCEKKLKNQKLTFVPGDTTNRELLDSLSIMEYDHVIVLAASGLETQEADARTLVTLLHLRNIVSYDETPFSIVSEMLDLRNRELAEVARVDDFIVSEHLISLMLAQLSENDNLFDVFQDIFAPEGAEIYLKPIQDYVETGQPVTFYTVVEAARRRGETALGYRVTAEANHSEKDYGVRTNPKKSEKVIFAPDDKIIVVAEE